ALEHEADVLLVQFRTLFRIETMDRLVHEVVLAGPRAVVHPKDVEQRRFPGARRPHDRNELAFLDVDVHTAQDVGAAHAVWIGFFDVAQGDKHQRPESLELEVRSLRGSEPTSDFRLRTSDRDGGYSVTAI